VLRTEANKLRRVGDGGVPRRRVAHRHDAHFGCYPVTEAEARDIMGDAELVNSDDYFRPDNL
jgi:hypothetical protein